MKTTKSEGKANEENIVRILKLRFAENMARHPEISWSEVERSLDSLKLEKLIAMENTGGEPDVIYRDAQSGLYVFCDCSEETPFSRRGLCYDEAALKSRKNAKPAGSVEGMCERLKIKLIDEDTYRLLQTKGDFDTKTSSWILTPADIREKGGAVFCDKRYGHVFVYHNGAESYYSSRGFRGMIKV